MPHLIRIISITFMFSGVLISLFQCTNPHFDDLQMTSEIDEETFLPLDDVDTFDISQETIYVAGRLNDVLERIEISVEWIYYETDEYDEVTEITLAQSTITSTATRFYFWLILTELDTVKPGDYEARLFIEDTHEETVPFTITD